MAISGVNDYSVVENNIVTNVIMIRPTEVAWYEGAFNCELVQRDLYGLQTGDQMQIGDYREYDESNNATWYRDVQTWDEATEAEIKVKTALAQAEAFGNNK